MLSSPDPPNYSEGDVGSEVISEITIGEESEDASADSGDELPVQINYYQLLPQDIPNGESNGNGHSMSEEEYSLESAEQINTVNGTEATTIQTPNKERIDIEVNDDEVRAAMQNIVLPPSAIPPWAANVPESQWTAFLLSRITNLNRNNKS